VQVKVAGYNIDSSLIAKLDSDVATPEVLSAAYARISRSKKNVEELRIEALEHIAKARNSNEKIIFEMGHASVAEHAVFNLDLIGISRHLTELVQRSRLASFTEKSQRYVTFEKDYLIPAELEEDAELSGTYTKICDALFKEYLQSTNLLAEHLAKRNPNLDKRTLLTMAKEDARYILPLATKTQMGMTINCRSLEVLLTRLNQSPLNEAKQLYELIYSQVSKVAPSLLRYTDADKDCFNLPDLEFEPSSALPAKLPHSQLLSATANADARIIALMYYEQGKGDLKTLEKHFATLSPNELSELWQGFFQGLKPWQKLPRAFELMEFEYLVTLSESAWAQFKRHRTATLIKASTEQQNTEIIIPASIREINRSDEWKRLFKEVKNHRRPLPRHLGAYLHLNAESTSVYAKLNLRELYHFSRLRCDEHAQWEIRDLAQQMVNQANPHAPCATSRLGGKSQFDTLS